MSTDSTSIEKTHSKKPTPFDGNRKEVNSFLLECELYMDMNETAFTNDKQKIGFVLSYMTEKEARLWKEQYIGSLRDIVTRRINYPTYEKFIETFQESFSSVDSQQEAMNELSQLKQGKKTAEEHIIEFRLLVGKAGLQCTTPSDHVHLISVEHGYAKPAGLQVWVWRVRVRV
jgi:hypothetical protein